MPNVNGDKDDHTLGCNRMSVQPRESPTQPYRLRVCQRSLCSAVSQPLLLLFRELAKLFSEALRSCRALEEVDKEALSLVIALTTTSRLFGGKGHQLLSAKTTTKVDEWVCFILPVVITRVFFCKLSSSLCVERRARGGLKFDNEHFENLEGGGNYGILVRI